MRGELAWEQSLRASSTPRNCKARLMRRAYVLLPDYVKNLMCVVFEYKYTRMLICVMTKLWPSSLHTSPNELFN
eukprot:325335-Pleurochrysis_carterae.AAC.1